MSISASSVTRNDGRLWAIALGLSLLANVAILGFAGYAAIKVQVFRRVLPVTKSIQEERVVTIFPEISHDEAANAEDGQQEFARTSPDQTAAAPEKADFIGERDTQATSDRAPDPSAPPLPSQAGVERHDENDLETTDSDYRDGQLTGSQAISATALVEPSPVVNSPDTTAARPSDPGEKLSEPGQDESSSSPPPPEKLLDSPYAVDVPIPKEIAKRDEIKPTPPKQKRDGSSSDKPSDQPKPAAPTPSNDPAFAGYQRKTAIVGSISRNGTSALNVADSPLGRYQALISRAVELEWQRNCVRHRDFITPGYLSVRFYVEASGKIRTVQFVGQMETGEVQKGFTLSSIRDADIPPMPASVKKEYDKQPLELIFNFYF